MLQMSEDQLLIELDGFADLSHPSPSKLGHCSVLSAFAAGDSDQLNGLKALWGLLSLLLILNYSAKHHLEFF